jgi:hypothetical protein
VALVWMFFDKLRAFVATISENGDRPAAPAP